MDLKITEKSAVAQKQFMEKAGKLVAKMMPRSKTVSFILSFLNFGVFAESQLFANNGPSHVLRATCFVVAT